MAEKDKRLIALGKGSSGGGGDAVWGSITGTLSDQTDLKNALDLKVDITSLATVATSGSYDDLTNKPTIPTVNDATITFEDSGGTTIDSFTLNQSSNKTITIPSGGGSIWYGTQEQFDAIPQEDLDYDTDYYISSIDYSEISNTPYIPAYLSDLNNDRGYISATEIENKIFTASDYLRNLDVYLTQVEYDALELAGELDEDKNYHIENDVDVLEMVVTFTDSSTATYNVYIQPSNGSN